MGLLVLALLCYGVFGIACGSECVPETARCSQYWVKIENHKDLMESEHELDAWCSQQPRFYKCLEDVLLADKNGNLSYLPTNLMISKLFAEDLCTEGSTSRRRYLNNAACINQQNTERCTEPEYLNIVTSDNCFEPSKCSLSEKTFSCIAATLVLNCGFDAGRVYRSLLKITHYSEEVCGIETSRGIQPCEERGYKKTKQDEKNTDIFYGLVHRIGNIPEQDLHAEALLSSEESEESVNEAVTEAIENALNFLDENSMSDQKEKIVSDEVDKSESKDDVAETIENVLNFPENTVFDQETLSDEVDKSVSEDEAVMEALENVLNFIDENSMSDQEAIVSNEETEESKDDAVTEAITSALNILDENVVSDQETLVSNEVVDKSEGSKDEAVTEVIKNALNFLEDAVSEETDVSAEEVEIIHIPKWQYVPEPSKPIVSEYREYRKYPIITKVFRDILFYNYSSLEYAVYWRQPEFTVLQNFTCEHLQPSYMRGVVFRCIMEFRTDDPDCVSKATEHEPVTPELIRDLDPDVPEDSVVEFGPRPYWMKDLDEAYEAKRLRESTTTTTETPDSFASPEFTTVSSTLLHLVDAVTEPPEPKWYEFDKHNVTMFLPHDILEEMVDLFPPKDPESLPYPVHNFQVGHTRYIFFYDPTYTNSVENLTCSRLDECHPRGKGLFKCKMMRRKIEYCGKCQGGTAAPVEGLPPTFASETWKPPVFKVDETTKPIAMEDDEFVTEVEFEKAVTDPTEGESEFTTEDQMIVSTEVPDGSGFAEVTPDVIALVLGNDVESETSDENESAANEIHVDVTNYATDTPIVAEVEESDSADVEYGEPAVRMLVLDENSVRRLGDSYMPELVYEIDGVVDNVVPEGAESSDDADDDDFDLLNGNVIVLQTVPPVGNAEVEYTIIHSPEEVQDIRL